MCSAKPSTSCTICAVDSYIFRLDPPHSNTNNSSVPTPSTEQPTGPVQMVTSPGVSTTPAVATPADGGKMVSSEEKYTATLKKMEEESITDLEKAFEETAKKAKEASDKIWGDLEAEFAEDEA